VTAAGCPGSPPSGFREPIISWKRRHAPTLLVLTAAVFLGVGSASADPTRIQSKQAEAQQVLEQIHLMDMQLDQAVERYNLANIQLDRLEGELRKNTRLLGVARGSLRNANQHLSRRLVSLYVNGGEPSALEVVLGAESMADVMDRLDTIDRVGSQDARVVGDVTRFRTEVIARKERLVRARADQRQIVAARAAEKSSIEGQLASRQSMLNSIRGEIAQLQAEEQRRQERLAAEARARLAQQRTATAQAQAQSEAPTAVVVGSGELETVSAGITAAPPSRYGGVVGIAMQYLGVPYRWGGADPSGFDCSGFIMYVYAQVGVSLPHHAASQYGMGVPVSREELQAGDLVFFNGLGHAGIYVGGGSFIHAPHTGDVVKISSLYDSWYAGTWVGARRIL
jgi:cell wall-associated NlpC family hydrolase